MKFPSQALLLLVCLSMAKLADGQALRAKKVATSFEDEQKQSRNNISTTLLASSSALSDHAATNDDQRELAENLDVLIIGAGWAGLGAANRLKNKGVGNYRICEGRDRIGGRSLTMTFDDGKSTAEIGSQWIQGASTENPVYNAANKAGISSVKSSHSGGLWSNVYGGSTPHQVPKDDVNAIFNTYYKKFIPFQLKRQYNNNQDETLRTTATRFENKNKINGDERLGFEYAVRSEIELEYAASLQDLSMRWWDTGHGMKGGDVVLEQGKGNGYTGVIDSFAAPHLKKIDLNCKVTKIDYSSKRHVIVTYESGGRTSTYRAKSVVVTVPLGVLQAGDIRFKPQLPRKKTKAIAKLGMGTLDKFIMKWDDKTELPWPDDLEWIQKIAASGEEDKWTSFFNERKFGNNVLIGFVAGREAERIELLEDSQITDEVMASLRDMFGDVPEPAETYMTRWKDDEFSKGSYSYHELGSRPEMRDDLGETVNGKLYFAGEAVHRHYPSTTQGALMTGEDAAQAIVDKRRGKRRLKEASIE